MAIGSPPAPKPVQTEIDGKPVRLAGAVSAGRSRKPHFERPALGGASPACDGQILVLEDMLGLSEWAPKFVKRFGSLREHIEAAVEAYAGEVRGGSFPGPEHVYKTVKR